MMTALAIKFDKHFFFLCVYVLKYDLHLHSPIASFDARESFAGSPVIGFFEPRATANGTTQIWKAFYSTFSYEQRLEIKDTNSDLLL